MIHVHMILKILTLVGINKGVNENEKRNDPMTEPLSMLKGQEEVELPKENVNKTHSELS